MLKQPRVRDFIETVDELIFSVISYTHPKEGYLASLRYFPFNEWEREKKKVLSTKESFKFLKQNFPEYLFGCTRYKLQYVPADRVFKFYYPAERLQELEKAGDVLERKVLALSDFFSEIPLSFKGVTGSILVGLQRPESDIDFVIYGLKNHEKARSFLRRHFRRGHSRIRELSIEEYKQVYRKRFPVKPTMDFEEFLWHERRKFHRGVVDGTLFDILAVRNYDEIEQKRDFKPVSRVKERCTVTDAASAFDSPAVYGVKCRNPRINEVVSFTHTYAGQAFEGEEIEVSGLLEEAENKELRITVGTTREAEGEYIKVIKKSF